MLTEPDSGPIAFTDTDAPPLANDTDEHAGGVRAFLEEELNHLANEIERCLESDVMAIVGPIYPEVSKSNPAVDARLLAELELLMRARRELGLPSGPGYRLSPPLGRRPLRGMQPPKPAHEPLRFRPSVRR